jgi:hypothetical protein
MMERSEILTTMAELKLYGMKARTWRSVNGRASSAMPK